MKTLLFLLTFCGIYEYSSAQCRVQTNHRDDGVTVRYMSPDRVGHSDIFFLGLSMQATSESYFIASVSIFEHSLQGFIGNMVIKFKNNKSSTFNHISDIETTFNGYPATLSIWETDKNDLINISQSDIQFVLMQLDDGVAQTIKPLFNANILRKQYNCLKQ